MATGKLGVIEFRLNAIFQKTKVFVQGKHPKTNLLHSQWIMDFLLLKFARRELQSLDEGKKILDVGCGSAPYWHLNTKLNWAGIDIYKSDKITHLIDSTGNFPLQNETFDYVLCTQVFEHVNNFEKSASEIVRVLKPGGKLIFNSPYLYPFHGMPHDYFRYTTSALESIFKDLTAERIGFLGGYGSSLGTIVNNFWDYKFASSTTMRIIGLIFWPLQLISNLFWNLLSIPLDKIDNTKSFPLNVFLIGIKPKN